MRGDPRAWRDATIEDDGGDNRSRSIWRPARNYPFLRLARDLRHELEVGVVMQHDEVPGLSDGSYQPVHQRTSRARR